VSLVAFVAYPRTTLNNSGERQMAEKQSTRLLELKKLFDGGKRSPSNTVIMFVDPIRVHGSNDEILDAFALIPPEKKYAHPRMLLLRRLLQLGPAFITNDHYRRRFDSLSLLNGEIRQMAHSFGSEATTEFLKPTALREAS
jgi:hypothetical protein